MLFVKLLLALALCLHLPMFAFAHPGGTDSSGGHTDHDTGDYHYHHGYPAHDHYDMDGDGIVDCPYRFDDKTGSSSNESSKSFDEELEEELERLRKEKANATEPSFDDVPAIETSEPLWLEILQAIICTVCFYGIFSIPGLLATFFKKIFKKK